MTLIKVLLAGLIALIAIFLSGCGAAVPIAAGVVETTVELAPIVVPIAIDVSSRLASQAELQAQLDAEAQASVDLQYSHAEKHGEITAATIRQLCDNGGALRLYQEDKNRFIQVCQIDTRYGCRIMDLFGRTWYEVTAYVKDCFTGKSLDDIDDYASKHSWSRSNEVIK